jgi:hypothetical protein
LYGIAQNRSRAAWFNLTVNYASHREQATTLYRKVRTMNSFKMVGLVLIIVGALGLAYGGFSYTKDTTALKLGSLELKVQERETINVPLWAGISAIVLGAALIVFSGKGR